MRRKEYDAGRRTSKHKICSSVADAFVKGARRLNNPIDAVCCAARRNSDINVVGIAAKYGFLISAGVISMSIAGSMGISAVLCGAGFVAIATASGLLQRSMGIAFASSSIAAVAAGAITAFSPALTSAAVPVLIGSSLLGLYKLSHSR